jgi:hypothetical protein
MARNSKHRSAASAPGAAGLRLGAVGTFRFYTFNPFSMRTFLLGILFTVITSLAAFGTPPSVVLVQMHSRTNAITITRGPRNTRTIDIADPAAVKSYDANAEKLLAVFSELYADGYELKNSTVSNITPSGGAETVTYVFVKP